VIEKSNEKGKRINGSQQMSSIKIMRFDPASGKEQMLQKFQVPYVKGLTVMDGLIHIYQNLDSSLAFRSSCQSGLCFLCLIQIDGKPKCPCKTFLTEEMMLEPLKNREIIRDLVVELDKE
jgi:succinate dehydrogenase/fumarate reductase iron-sulfur protein